MRKRLSVILTMLVVLALVAVSAVAVTYAAGGATTTPTGTPLTQENISNYKQEKNSTYSENGVYLPAGSYYLAEDIYLVGDDADTNSAWPLIFEGDVTLDLNGHVLDLKKQNICIYSNVSLTDSSPEAEHKFRVEDSGLWVLDETQGTETVTGGVITGGTGVDSVTGILGGGVSVFFSSFTMNGGSIVGCTANNGGGVSVFYGSFTMNSGSIAGCTAVKSGNAYGNGGGVYVGDSATFTMNDGSIVGCTADSGSVFVDGSATFNMNDGSIENCTADIGGGVYVGNLATFNMNDGSIVGCTADIGGGVYMGGLATFNMNDGSIESCTADNGGGVYMGGGAQFEMKSGGEGKNPTIKNCIAVRAGGGVYMDGLGTFNMTGGNIESCTADNGGGVYVGDGAQFEMKGGGEGKNPTIKNCIAVRAGGGVFVDGSATFTMNDGSIEDCKASGAANAVHADGNFTDNSTNKIDKSLVSGINAGHTGSETDPILIGSVEGLKDFRNRVNRGNTGLCATLLCDIVLNDGTFDENGTYTGANGSTSAEQWTPIGTDSAPYAGTFDGGGHTIKGLYVNKQIAGLFGEIGGATIRDVTVDGYVKGTSVAGGIAGMASNSATSIQNCANRCYVVAEGSGIGSGYAGGIVGFAAAGSISGCYNTCAVSGIYYVGGIAGSAAGGSISSCYNTGAVSGTTDVGGVAGYASASTVSSCYNTGTVSGDKQVGGVAGYASASTVSSCYNTGTVSGTTNVGGVAGWFTGNTGGSGSISSCYNTGAVSGTTNVGGVVGCVLAAQGTEASVSDCYNTGKVSGDKQVGGVAGTVEADEDANASITSCCCLTGTAEKTIGENAEGTVTSVDAKTKAEFADGTVLKLLKQNDTTNAWQSECGYLSAAGMTLPLLSWQTTDMHTCTPETPSQWESDESGHWQVCSCGLSVNKAAHSGTDDDNCTTDVSCDKCGYVIKLAQTEHDWTAGWTAVRPGTTHEKACTNPGCGMTKTESCTGGTATCKEQATCEVCGKKYGELKSHSYSTDWRANETNHWHECTECRAKTDEAEHTDANMDHKCDVCEKVLTACADNNSDHKCDLCGKTLSEHTGGEATCTEKAACTICGEKYGDMLPHDYSTDWSCDAAKHWRKCKNCDAKSDEAAHNDADCNHKCDLCNAVISECADNNSNHECDICKKVLSLCTDNDNNHECDICGIIISQCSDVNSDHKCDTCGKILSRCTDTNNDHKCDICGKIVSQCSDTDSDHKCDICGKMLSECADTDHDHKCDICSRIINEHTGGKATCSEKAICIICGEQYGEIAAHIYKSEWSSDANNHFHECSICGDKKDQAAHDLKWIADKEPTVTEAGIKHEECTVCGYKNTPQSIDKIAPSIIEGNGSNWTKGSKTTLTFRSDAASADFVAVLVDGEILASDYYEKREDSLTTELKPDYLETLSEGEHTLTIRSVSGDASAKFTIEARPVSTLWIILPAVIVVCGGAGAALYFISKRKKH